MLGMTKKLHDSPAINRFRSENKKKITDGKIWENVNSNQILHKRVFNQDEVTKIDYTQILLPRHITVYLRTVAWLEFNFESRELNKSSWSAAIRFPNLWRTSHKLSRQSHLISVLISCRHSNKRRFIIKCNFKKHWMKSSWLIKLTLKHAKKSKLSKFVTESRQIVMQLCCHVEKNSSSSWTNKPNFLARHENQKAQNQSDSILARRSCTWRNL
jgi:hypothetical protein